MFFLKRLPSVLAVFFLSAFTPFHASEPHSDYAVIENEAKLPILTPSLDSQKILKLKLKNGLEAYLISDPGTDTSAAGIAVNAGSWSNPVDYPGLAHFLEHMLFLGTKKYPNESEFQRFIDNHGGKENAFTANDRTVFSFTIDNDAFPEALDRFAQFFIAPLFNPSGLQREAHAVDQEYAKNLESDNWRLLYVRKALENPAHPDSRFNIGNLQTISPITPDMLRHWYETHYSANLMHLVLYSNLPIEKLRDLVVKDFSAVPDRRIQPLEVNVPLTLGKDCGHFVYVTPFQDIRSLILFWEMPSKYRYDADIVAYAIGDESHNSLLATLKKEGLADGLSAEASKHGNRLVFSLEISLTEKGVKNLQPVVALTFDTLHMLASQGIPKSFFEEIKSLAEIKYQYQSRHDPFDLVTDYAEALVDEDLDTFPEKTLIPQTYHSEGIAAVIHTLEIAPCQFYIVADPKLTGVAADRQEPWMGAKYAIRPMPKDIADTLAKLQPSGLIALPPANPFVPKHLELVPISTSATEHLAIKNLPIPKLLQDNEKGQFYFSGDANYKVPEAAYLFRIHTPAVTPGNPNQAVLLELFIKGLKESLASTLYQASLANLTFKLDSLETGLFFSIKGYSERSFLLLSDIMQAFKTFTISQDVFEQIKQTLMSEYQNASLSSPLKQAEEGLKSTIFKYFITPAEKADALASVTRDDLLAFSHHLFTHTYIKGMLYGNLTEPQAMEAISEVNSTLSSSPYPKDEIKEREVLFLSNEKGPFILSKNITPKGNAAFLMLQNKCYSFKEHAALQILGKGMEEPFFTQLRTKQQTGYIVASLNQEIQKQLLQFFIVQSNTYDPRDLLSRFDLMIESFLQSLETEGITEERFETLKKTVANELTQPPKNLQEMSNVLAALAFDHDGHFNRLVQRLDGIQALTYAEFIDFVKEFLGKTNRRRLAVLVYGQEADNVFRYTAYNSITPIQKASRFLTKKDVPDCDRP